MTRLRLPARRRVLIALMLIFALLIFLPLRLALGSVGEGLSARGRAVAHSSAIAAQHRV